VGDEIEEVPVRRFVRSLAGALLVGAAAMSGPAAPWAFADDAPDPGVEHHQAPPATRRSTADYKLPSVKLVRDDGKIVSLAEELNDDRPVVMNFIFTTCTAICPVMSQVFSQLQSKLGGDRGKVHMVSISIDPEQDTPAHLAEYARKFAAGPQWRYYTGTTEASIATQRAFDVYRGDKMSHLPVTLLRAAPGRPWVRIEGFATSDELLREFRELVAPAGDVGS
jgi:protein SCO1/2